MALPHRQSNCGKTLILRPMRKANWPFCPKIRPHGHLDCTSGRFSVNAATKAPPGRGGREGKAVISSEVERVLIIGTPEAYWY